MDLADEDPDQQWLDTVIGTVGLGDRLKHRPSELSGGQQQRVAVARALASRPQIVFADEPTGNLDSRAGAEILTFMRKAVDELDQTIVMVTHDPVAASYADTALFLVDGRIVDSMAEPTAREGPRPAEGARRLAMLKLTWKNLLAHKRRLAATFIAVVLGVAFLSGNLVLTDTITQTFDDLFADVNRGTDAVVRNSVKIEGDFGNDIRGRVPTSLLSTVEEVDGVRAAEPQVLGYGQIVGKDGKTLGDPGMGAPTFAATGTRCRS